MSERIVTGKAHDLEAQVFDSDTVRGVEKRILIGEKHNAPNFVMRLFTVKPGGYSPRHSHDWEHEVFIVKGEATVVTPEGEIKVSAGSYVYVPKNVEHQFKNETEDILEFICVVPVYAEK
ncbi:MULTISPECIES: cupin domain-containing protein [Kosmotoga]|uniref:Cupin 2 conserved barrel domain protein n=1 Tax=Kosmotoga olearia (strain ATCC BAA-1733 / DSM 21960 / TBF 19.5.1) TaxID=521045 RepID=C5CD34_KOSOT|nr:MULTISPECIES: cupin domain-containing protein [Kosmotoga]ACR78978.1 Cupin 2 conserved barrel domain protein [Kosmotoga olearia TBF 19.5.1]MDI3524720.1 hypothetical protein [Kosmotoga sp.]MDK2953418.1 hypothetical protein [Kosmotoga sp.]OAA24029.1 cupin [Kosmotoga sp. DU53]